MDFLLGRIGLQRKSNEEQAKKQDQDENAKIIAAGDADKLNARLDDKLRH